MTVSAVRRTCCTSRTSWVGSMAEATPGWVPVAVHVLTRLSAITWVAVMMAMRCPSMVTR